MMDKKDRILHSLDVKCLKSRLKLILSFYIGLLVLGCIFGVVVFWGFPKEQPKAILYVTILFTTCYLPAVIYYVWKIVNIVKRYESYFYCETILSEPHSERGRYYFDVSVNLYGTKIKSKTATIFNDSSSYASVNDWMNKKVIVAYDSENDMVLVVDKVN